MAAGASGKYERTLAAPQHERTQGPARQIIRTNRRPAGFLGFSGCAGANEPGGWRALPDPRPRPSPAAGLRPLTPPRPAARADPRLGATGIPMVAWTRQTSGCRTMVNKPLPPAPEPDRGGHGHEN